MKTEPEQVTIPNILNAIDDAYLQGRLDTIYNQQASIIDQTRLNELINLHGDFSRRVCFKTGTMLDTLDCFHLMRLFEICPDEDFAVRILKRQAIQNCVVHWLYTDGESLDKLMEIDPLGYFVYAAAYVCDRYAPTAQNEIQRRFQEMAEYTVTNEDGTTETKYAHLTDDEKSRIKKDALFDWVMQKAQLREMVQQYPLAQIVRVNEILRRYLSFFSATGIPITYDNYYMLRDSEEDAILPAVGRDIEAFELYVISTIKQIIRVEVKAGRIKDPHSEQGIDYNTALKLQQRYKGLQNFFAQYQPMPTSEHDKRGIMLDGFIKLAEIPQSEANKREKIERALRDGKIIAMNKGYTIAKTSTKGTTYSFGKKHINEEIKLEP